MYDYAPRTTCRICGSANLYPYLDLGAQPPSNSFISVEAIPHEVDIPLVVCLCTDCGMSQLSVVVSANEVFGEYAYRSSSSRALEESFRGLARDVQPYAQRSNNKPLVVDIGCNDGLFLAQLPRHEYRILGVEPSSAAQDARDRGFEVSDVFFGEQTALQLLADHGPADVITTSNVLAHVDDIHSYLEGVSRWLGPRGCFILEFPYIGDMLQGLWFDTVYHEHVSYLAITPLQSALKSHGLHITKIDHHDVGGSGPFVRVFIEHVSSRPYVSDVVETYERRERIWGLTEPSTYSAFAASVGRLAGILREEIDRWQGSGHVVGGFGAPAKGNTLLNFLGLTSETVSVIADNTEGKIGLVTPGSHIPIVDDSAFLDVEADIALLLSWNYLDYFMAHSEYIRRGGRFLCPFPTPHIRSNVDNSLR